MIAARAYSLIITLCAVLLCFPSAAAALHFPHVSANTMAQQRFEQGMLNYFGYLYVQAEYDFRQALLYDPNCGMCFFGLALAKKQEALELGMPFAQVGYAFMQRAQKLMANQPAFYQDLIQVAKKSFSDKPRASSKHLQVDYINGLKALWEKNKNTAWRAESLALWVDGVAYYANVENEDMGDIVLGHCGHNVPSSYKDDALKLMRQALSQDEIFWHHPGILHTYIHMAERDLEDPLALRAAQLLPPFSQDKIAHYTHMPNHIYWRRGMFKEAIQANLDAIKIDQHYFKSGGAGLNSYYYEYHYLHSHHFLVALGILTQNYDQAIKYAREIKQLMDVARMSALPDYRDTFLTLEHVVNARFAKWSQVLALPTPFGTGALGSLFIQFTKGLAYLNTNNILGYQQALAAVKESRFTNPVNTKLKNLMLAYLQATAMQQQARANSDIENVFAKYKVATIEQDFSIMNPPLWFFSYRDFRASAKT